MVEIYFNAQSDNGTLTNGELAGIRQDRGQAVARIKLNSNCILARSCSPALVPKVPAERPSIQRSPSSLTDGGNVAQRGLRRCRVSSAEPANVCLAE